MWYVSFSKTDDNDEKNTNNLTGSIYSLRCYKCGPGDQNFVTSSILTGSQLSIQNEDTLDLSGSQIIIGSQSLDFNTRYGLYKIQSSDSDYNMINWTNFSGKLASIRFSDTFLNEKEVLFHSRDYRNYGSLNPNLSSIFLTGSGRLRLNIDANQPQTGSVGEKIVLFNLTKKEENLDNELKSFVDGFENKKSINTFEKFIQRVSPNKIDEINSSNKIRIRSLEVNPDLNLGYQSLAPVFDLSNSQEPGDDARFSIEMSIARLINEKINNEIAGTEFFENILGKENNSFAYSYKELDFFSRNFFKSFEGDIKIDSLLNVYTWLEASFEEIMRKSLPKKTKFLGMNFVVEPHTLERSKIRLNNENTYMTDIENNENINSVNEIQVYNANITDRF